MNKWKIVLNTSMSPIISFLEFKIKAYQDILILFVNISLLTFYDQYIRLIPI